MAGLTFHSGKIQSLSVKPESGETDSTQSATVTFEKETAAKTALLLDNTQLESAALSYSYQLATWSNETAGATGSPQPPAPSNEVVQKVLGIATSS